MVRDNVVCAIHKVLLEGGLLLDFMLSETCFRHFSYVTFNFHCRCHHVTTLLIPEVFEIILNPRLYRTHYRLLLTILSYIILFSGVHTLENYECLPFLVDFTWLPVFYISGISNFANIHAAFVETSGSVVCHFFLGDELLLIIDIVVDLDVLGPLDVEGVRTVEVIYFLPVFLVHHSRLET